MSARLLAAPLTLLAVLVVAGGALAASLVVVPPGNRSPTQPPVSHSSLVRTNETGGTFDAKFRAVYDSLAGDPGLIDKIVKTSAVYGIDPIHVVGAIVGEHTYNVDIMDSLQGYYVKALSYFNQAGLSFGFAGETIEAFLSRPEFAPCGGEADDYALWSCRDRVWRQTFQGKTVGGKTYPDDRFTRVFFQPFFAGQTFGLGQLSPVSALMVSDVVHAKAGLPLLDASHAPAVYRAIMDPDMTLNYMAALIARDIQTYRDVAGFDISGNPGLTATLYNVGVAAERAADLAAENRKRRAAGLSLVYPRENFYGWLINDRLADLKKLLPPESGAVAKSN